MVLSTPKFFGRRKGRTIRKAKSFLLENFLNKVRLSPDTTFDVQKMFGKPVQKVFLEIGFGDGEHLAELSCKMKDVGFVGVEVFQNGVANLLSLITGVKDGQNLSEDIAVLSERADNVRIFDDDVRLLFKAIPDGFFDKIYLLFPDPWPKKRHENRRFVNPDNLKELSRILKKGGILQIATDHPIYKRHVLRTMRANKDFVWTAKTSADWRNPPQDWFETKYQRKALREGRRPVFFEYEKKFE
ncbi:MAG: tRNA (guanosine(46)-N7)-methyltransferase TrmB [Alphaproteobacteria bacterium]|nr:tRNA (guanosine(46)-N7)-methyltransferase TrmB [Alphaproteobacteria bacterium]